MKARKYVLKGSEKMSSFPRFKKSDYYYDLPKELIAQHPLPDRDASRLLIIDKKSGAIDHKHFESILDYITPEDCLILNDTRVIPARLYGTRLDTGATVEILLLHQAAYNSWEVIAGPGKKAKAGAEFEFGNGIMSCKILEVKPNGNRVAEFKFDGNFFTALDKCGEIPLPHYITEKLGDSERYQTVYSKSLGSAAAPTAGLHFTQDLLNKIKSRGIQIGYLTLHVGLGTFRPVKEEIITNHIMHSEHYELPESTAELINKTKNLGGKVVSVGTTCARTLESLAKDDGKVEPGAGWTDIFIYPGYEFRCVDALITNFHLPESTLIMLVAAFAGYENVMNAYKTAVEEKYRFYSFGDAMLII